MAPDSSFFPAWLKTVNTSTLNPAEQKLVTCFYLRSSMWGFSGDLTPFIEVEPVFEGIMMFVFVGFFVVLFRV